MSGVRATLSADEVVRLLGLSPHPEGGFFRETFRDVQCAADGRAASTAIYFLLPAGVLSRWHRVDAAEGWHWYGGAPLALSMTSGGGAGASTVLLGGDLAAGEVPQAIVPAGWWQQAESRGAWTLAGCTVAPGFEFALFEMASEGFSP